MNFFSSALAGFLVVRFPATTYANDATISICSAPGFTGLRDCARSCFDRGACGTLANAISCWVNSQALNSCYCRLDLVPAAESYLSSCVASACSSNPVDIGSAVNLYTSYCSSTALAAAPIPTSSFLGTSQVVPTRTSIGVDTSGSNSNGRGVGGLSQSDKIALGVGLSVPMAALYSYMYEL